MPLPLNQSTKRDSMAPGFAPVGSFSAAYAVPAELNMETSGGIPTSTGACESVSPLRKIRRESLGRRVITFGIRFPPRDGLIPPYQQGYHQLLQVELRFPEIFQGLVQQRPVGRGVETPGHITK